MGALSAVRRIAAEVVEAARGAREIVVFASVNGHAQAMVTVPTRAVSGRVNKADCSR